MPEAFVEFLTPAALAEVMKAAGYRANLVTREGAPQLQSAAQGLNFFASFGNAVPGRPGSFVDFAFLCCITIQGELLPGLIEDWNHGMRFARLFRQGELLVLSMDVSIAGGVSDAFLGAQLELWDRVLHDFIRHARRTPAPLQAAAAGAPA